jgi:hypothetical protein
MLIAEDLITRSIPHRQGIEQGRLRQERFSVVLRRARHAVFLARAVFGALVVTAFDGFHLHAGVVTTSRMVTVGVAATTKLLGITRVTGFTFHLSYLLPGKSTRSRTPVKVSIFGIGLPVVRKNSPRS